MAIDVPDAWRRMPEMPTPEEVMSTRPSPLPVNDTRTAPRSKEEYLYTQYTLNRAEGVEPLRRGIAEYRDEHWLDASEQESFYVYPELHLQGYLFSKSGPACRLDFSMPSDEQICSGHSGRLTAGTAVVLSTTKDNFAHDCRVAVVGNVFLAESAVAGRDFYCIDIFWADDGDLVLDPSESFVMLEMRSAYFESSRHTLLALQEVCASSQTKFDRYLMQSCPPFVSSSSQAAEDIRHLLKSSDESQQAAFTAMTRQEMTVVQGPPGTGKTFTSLLALRYFLTCSISSSSQTVIVAAETNHAVDQILRACLDQGIGRLLRLGGRADDEKVQEHSLFQIRQKAKSGLPRGLLETRKRILKKVLELLKQRTATSVSPRQLLDLQLITEEQYESLQSDGWEGEGPDKDSNDEENLRAWLGEKETVSQKPADPEVELCFVPEFASFESLGGEFVDLRRVCPTLGSKNSAKVSPKVASCPDLYRIKPSRRLEVYQHFVAQYQNKATQKIQRLFAEYHKICEELRAKRTMDDAALIQREDINLIGCTVTGLNKYRSLLNQLQPTALLVEEASETKEANLIPTLMLSKSLEKVIFVGDHQQLGPHVDVQILARPPYNLDVSMFERLVVQGFPYHKLKVQRRMVPALSEVVRTFYPEIEDHVSVVKKHVAVPGMKQNLWWHQHAWPESRDSRRSCFNLFEAEFIAEFISYLLDSGVRAGQITVLTMYLAQVTLLRRSILAKVGAGCLEFPEDNTANGGNRIRVCTVDGYQGEENDIILLSLVRSPQGNGTNNTVGFLAKENRAIVSLSRARVALYVFGNAKNLLGIDGQDTWGKVFDVFEKRQVTDNFLPVGPLDEQIRTLAEWRQVRRIRDVTPKPPAKQPPEIKKAENKWLTILPGPAAANSQARLSSQSSSRSSSQSSRQPSSQSLSLPPSRPPSQPNVPTRSRLVDCESLMDMGYYGGVIDTSGDLQLLEELHVAEGNLEVKDEGGEEESTSSTSPLFSWDGMTPCSSLEGSQLLIDLD